MIPGGMPERRRWPEDRGGEWHFIHQYMGGVAESLCLQSVPVEQLADPGIDPETDEAPTCFLCLLNLGKELGERHGDRDRYAL